MNTDSGIGKLQDLGLSTVFDRLESAADAPEEMVRTKEIGPDIGDRLREARGDGTIRALATKAQVSTKTIVDIEAGRGATSSLRTFHKLARALGVRPCWLCFGEGSPTKES